MLYADEMYAILGACFEVYKRMGCGFLYLHGTKMQVGLLANFGHYPKLEYKRLVV